MKRNSTQLPKLKLRESLDKMVVDVGEGARKAIKKRSLFLIYGLYRLAASLIVPFFMGASIVIERYADTGILSVSMFNADLMALNILNAGIIILIFTIKTLNLRTIVRAIVDNKDYTQEQIVNVYQESFRLPASITIWELVLSIIFVLLPAAGMEKSGIHPLSISISDIAIAWWFGTLPLLLATFQFTHDWVEKVIMRLYDYGIRISSGEGIKRNGSIYIRVSTAIGSIILTVIILYSNMLYKLSSELPGERSTHMIQIGFVSATVLIGTFIFFWTIFKSIKKAFDILEHKMKSVQQGDYSVRLLNHRDDQLGRLYDDFDYLISTLNNVLGSLENEVQKRTAKLEDVTAKIARYVSPQLYAKIYSEDSALQLSYTRKKLTIFFSDIAGFTNATENLAPEDLSRILNQYLDAMAEIALSWGGTIDKYIGDAILIFFGDPEFTDDRDHAVRCVGMAREMLDRLEKLRNDWENGGITIPLHIRIGIGTGFCTVGNFGSENRMDYTVIGGTVNMASRLQTAASLDTILVSEATYLLVKDAYFCEPAGELSLKGFDHPVKAYRVINDAQILLKPMETHIQGMDLKLDPSIMTPETRKEIKEILKQIATFLEK